METLFGIGNLGRIKAVERTPFLGKDLIAGQLQIPVDSQAEKGTLTSALFGWIECMFT
jgi:hypothetical protein